ncbi:hypothetical protein, conserved [Trypanosoma cruzi]|uniref:Uncharacterized protein n=2 Tax=Trypanosoma cruzi TaxID=5693 RepID=Q4D8A8_TRYCC|nr:hypothetical protein, conserved [Trypanosoma cruzi]EAN88762.1 hypothetical protein, conserved [Trypanosoma cruzi]|eukprot:XP_810613.1 hypothetical protein [Trypanosoma cruzi strain CL Brener]
MLTFFAGAFVHAFPSSVYYFFCRGGNGWAFVSAAAGCFFLRGDARNGGSSMTLCTEGMELSPDSHRRRMPWTAEKECVPGVVHGSKGKMVLDGAQRVDVECVDRASQVYPLEALRAAVATCEYNTFGGKNIFNWSLRRNQMCSGNEFTARSGRRGRTTRTPLAPSFISVVARPQRSPRQYDLRIFRGGTRCSVCRHCSPSPSVGAGVPVDASSCGFRTHPLIDAADTPAHCWCFWHDRCTAPAAGAVGMGTRTQQTRFNQMVLAALSASRRLQRAQKSTG